MSFGPSAERSQRSFAQKTDVVSIGLRVVEVREVDGVRARRLRDRVHERRLLRRSRARSTEVTTQASAPSVSRQQS
jgi:hypothetical protein